MMNDGKDKLLKAVAAIVADTHPSKIDHLVSHIRKAGGKEQAMMLDGWATTFQFKDFFDS